MSQLLAVRDAARQLGVTYSTLKRWIHEGAVRSVKTKGGHHRIPDEEVRRLLAVQGAFAPASGALHGVLVAISGRNQIRGTVDEIRADGLLAQVRLRFGDQTLTAVITRDAVQELKLRRGDQAVAIIKSTAVMVGREQAAPSSRRKKGTKAPKTTKDTTG